MTLKSIILSASALVGSAFFASGQDLSGEFSFTRAEIDSTSYLLGINFGGFIRSYGFDDLDRSLTQAGLADYLDAVDITDMDEFMTAFMYSPFDLEDTFDAYLSEETRPDSLIAKTSYMIGLYFGSFIDQNGFPAPDFKRLDAGIDAFLKAEGSPSDEDFAKQFEIDPNCMGEYFDMIIDKQMYITLMNNLIESEAFLRLKKTQLNLTETESGLLYKIISAGDPAKKPVPSDMVTVLYRGTTMDGRVFDEHMDPDAPMSFTLSHLVQGWIEGLQLIGEGGKIMLYLHPDLGYGERGAGSDIAPNSALVFELTLLKVGE